MHLPVRTHMHSPCSSQSLDRQPHHTAMASPMPSSALESRPGGTSQSLTTSASSPSKESTAPCPVTNSGACRLNLYRTDRRSHPTASSQRVQMAWPPNQCFSSGGGVHVGIQLGHLIICEHRAEDHRLVHCPTELRAVATVASTSSNLNVRHLRQCPFVVLLDEVAVDKKPNVPSVPTATCVHWLMRSSAPPCQQPGPKAPAVAHFIFQSELICTLLVHHNPRSAATSYCAGITYAAISTVLHPSTIRSLG